MASNGNAASDPGSWVLVVDDDDLVRDMAVDLLQEAGFQALSARSADEALGILEQEPPDAFKTLLMDLVMPGTNPIVAMNRIAHRSPNLKVILMSGDDITGECLNLLQESGIRFLYKANLLTELIPLCQQAVSFCSSSPALGPG